MQSNNFYFLQQAFAKRLVNADRCALFMLDSKSEELYANLFDEGDEDGSGYKFRNGAEIRWDLKMKKMPINFFFFFRRQDYCICNNLRLQNCKSSLLYYLPYWCLISRVVNFAKKKWEIKDPRIKVIAKFKHAKFNSRKENSNRWKKKRLTCKVCNDQMMFRSNAANYVLGQCVSKDVNLLVPVIFVLI